MPRHRRRRDLGPIVGEDARPGAVQLGERNEVVLLDARRRRRHRAPVELVHAGGRLGSARTRMVEPVPVAPRVRAQKEPALFRQPHREAARAEDERRRRRPRAAASRARRHARAGLSAHGDRTASPSYGGSRCPPTPAPPRVTRATQARRRAAPRSAAAAPRRRPGTRHETPRSRRAARRRSSRGASSRPAASPSRAPADGDRARARARRTRARPCRHLRRSKELGERERRLVLDVLDTHPLGPPEEHRVRVRGVDDVVDLDAEVVRGGDVLVRGVDEHGEMVQQRLLGRARLSRVELDPRPADLDARSARTAPGAAGAKPSDPYSSAVALGSCEKSATWSRSYSTSVSASTSPSRTPSRPTSK